jgi:hypothetical protein
MYETTLSPSFIHGCGIRASLEEKHALKMLEKKVKILRPKREKAMEKHMQ